MRTVRSAQMCMQNQRLKRASAEGGKYHLFSARARIVVYNVYQIPMAKIFELHNPRNYCLASHVAFNACSILGRNVRQLYTGF